MASKSGARTAAPVHPGPIAAETIDDLGMSWRDAAKRLGMSPNGLNKVLNGKTPVTPETALRLSAFIGLPPETWLRMQNAYDLWHARLKIADSLGKIARAKSYK